MLGLIEDDLIEALGVDTTGVFGRNTIFGFPIEKWKEWRTPWGQEVLVPEAFRTSSGPSGDLLIYPEGDTLRSPQRQDARPEASSSIRSSARSPSTRARLDPKDNLEEFAPLTQAEMDHITRSVQEASERTGGSWRTSAAPASGISRSSRLLSSSIPTASAT